MRREIYVHFGDILIALSDAMDLASPHLSQHQQRTSYIAWQVAREAKLDNAQIENIFVSALLHDIGALTPEEKIDLHESEGTNPERHCIIGEILFRQLPWLQPASEIVRHHHKEWKEFEEPFDTPNVLESQIVCLADTLERFIDRGQYILFQKQELISKMESLSGDSLHPQIIDFFLATAKREEFWLDLISSRLYALLQHEGPYTKREINLEDTLMISEFFRNIIDFRSRFTSTHSSGVSACAAILSKLVGFSETDRILMKVAGNLHDLGKLTVPNMILEKNGKLDKEEFMIIQQHPYYTYSVLRNIRGLEYIAEWAAFHQEKLDGSGYPFHLTEKELSTGARILAVADVFTALAEDRPYRGGMPKDRIIRILRELVNQHHLDNNAVDTLANNYDEVWIFVQERQKATKDYYENQFGSFSTKTTA